MLRKWLQPFWGLVLMLGGGLLLIYNLTGQPWPEPQVWMIVFGVLGALFLATFFIAGLAEWGWLVPAGTFAGLAVMLGLIEAGVDGAPVVVPLFVGLAVPFLVAFALDRSRRALLIPGWIMVSLSIFMLLVDRAEGELLASLLMLLIALPFLFVYFARPEAWWALIPGGVLASVGLGLAAIGSLPAGAGNPAAWMNGTLFLGVAVTFGLLWLRRGTAPTRWAAWPAIGALAASLLAFTIDSDLRLMWPIALIVGGALLFIAALRPAIFRPRQ